MPCYIVFIKTETKSPVVYNLEDYLHAALAQCSDEGRIRTEAVLNSYDFEEGAEDAEGWNPILNLHDILSGAFFTRTGLSLGTPVNVSLHCCETGLEALAEAVEEWKSELGEDNSPSPANL
jgi:hypothetical protein